MTESIYVVHNNPAGRQAPYHIVNVDLSYSGLPGQVEQLWLNDLNDGTFRIACIPFCADGLSYLDVVSLDSAGGAVATVHQRSGHRVMRVLIRQLDAKELHSLKLALVAAADRCVVLYEWHGERFISFDIEPDKGPTELFELLAVERHKERIQFEWGDSEPFVFCGGPAIG